MQIETSRIHTAEGRNRESGDIADLKASIASLGLLEPLIVRRAAAGEEGHPDGWTLIAGERRLRACRELGMAHVNCTVEAVGPDGEEAIRLAENLHRRNLTALEEAYSVRRLCEECGGDARRTAEQSGRTQRHVATCLKVAAFDWGAARAAGAPLDKATLKTLAAFAEMSPEARSTVLADHLDAFADEAQMGSMAEASTQPLREAVFDRAGCAGCKRIVGEDDLFGDGERCADAECWHAKTLAEVRRRMAEAAERGGDDLPVVPVAWAVPPDWTEDAKRARVQALNKKRSRWLQTDGTDADAVGVVFCGPGQGETIMLKAGPSAREEFKREHKRARALWKSLKTRPLADATAEGVARHLLRWGCDPAKEGSGFEVKATIRDGKLESVERVPELAAAAIRATAQRRKQYLKSFMSNFEELRFAIQSVSAELVDEAMKYRGGGKRR